MRQDPNPDKIDSKLQAHQELWPIFRTLDSKQAPPLSPNLEDNSQGCILTLFGGLEAVVKVNPLDIIGQGCVGQQSPVPVDDVGRKSKGMLLSIHDLGVGAICILKDSSCEREVNSCVLGKKGHAKQRCLAQKVLWARFSPKKMFNNILDNSYT